MAAGYALGAAGALLLSTLYQKFQDEIELLTIYLALYYGEPAND